MYTWRLHPFDARYDSDDVLGQDSYDFPADAYEAALTILGGMCEGDELIVYDEETGEIVDEPWEDGAR